MPEESSDDPGMPAGAVLGLVMFFFCGGMILGMLVGHEKAVDPRTECEQASGWHKDQEFYLWGHNDTLARWHQDKAKLYQSAWEFEATCARWRTEADPAGHTQASGWEAS